PRWLAEAGGRAPYEGLDDSGFVYFGRYFRSRDVGFPPFMGPVLQHFDSVSTVTLPADNATWSVVIAGHAKDAALRGLKDADRWAAAIRCYPTVAPWIEAEPLDEGVTTMAKIEDRWRRFVIDGEPVATGVVAVGDSWACSNPSVGRGATIGMMWKTLDEIFAEMGHETILSTGGFWRDMPKMGPSRADLLKVVNA